MDLFDTSFVDLWKELNDYGVRYILVGGIAINFHGYQRFTGDMDLWIDDTLHNRKISAKHIMPTVILTSKALKRSSLFQAGLNFL